eukprot:766605-Hanusia_phi.AAC.2
MGKEERYSSEPHEYAQTDFEHAVLIVSNSNQRFSKEIHLFIHKKYHHCFDGKKNSTGKNLSFEQTAAPATHQFEIQLQPRSRTTGRTVRPEKRPGQVWNREPLKPQPLVSRRLESVNPEPESVQETVTEQNLNVTVSD